MNEETEPNIENEDFILPENPLPRVALADLPERLHKAAERAGWASLTPVQTMALPYLFAGRDMMIQARTGSGKTGAFILPMIELLNPLQANTQALVLVPTRELAQQVAKEAEVLCGERDLRITAVYGGTGYGTQLDGLRKGAHIVIGTPGRVLDHLLRRSLTLDDLRLLVFDEADRMLSMGFYPDMKRVQKFLPQRRVNAFMFSATFPVVVLRLAREFMHQPEFLSLSRDKVHVSTTEHVHYHTPPMDKDRSLVRIIEVENPPSAFIFCNTKVRVSYVTTVLKRFGYDADELSADLPQKDRDRVMERVRKGTLRFLVTTDVAARGIDIPDLSHVIQYEIPEDVELYVHRAGRTGRAGATGVAISLIGDVLEEARLRNIGKKYSIAFQERPLPSDDDVARVVAERTTVLLEAKLRDRDKLQTERMRRFLPLAQTLSQNEEELAVVAMLLDDYYQQSLHAPVAMPETAETPKQPQPTSGGKDKRRRRR